MTLRHFSQIQTLTILPFSIEPRFAEIADGWIYDPQMWDLTPEEHRRSTGVLCDAIRCAANGGRVCCAVGRQDRSKGFGWFTDLYVEAPGLRESMLFAFGGKVSGGVAAGLSAFEQAGGFACNRFVSDAEMLDLYAAADLIWCAYEPDYDQASGILGRAAQLGIPVIVRRDSLAHRLCRVEGLAHVAIDASTDWQQLTDVPPREDWQKAVARTQRMRDESLIRLREALGIAL